MPPDRRAIAGRMLYCWPEEILMERAYYPVGLESSFLRWWLRRKVRGAKRDLRADGINPHIHEKDVSISRTRNATNESTGAVEIFPLTMTKGTVRHELAHRAHILRSAAPTQKMRKAKRGKYLETDAGFAAISETLAILAERDWARMNELNRRLNLAVNYVGSHGQLPLAYVMRVANQVRDAWNTLKDTKTNPSTARKMILNMLYESKNLEELAENKNALKEWAKFDGGTLGMCPREVLAARRLSRWK